MIDWIRNIPAAFWGVVTGYLFALISSWLANRAQMRRLERQFAHERSIKKEERELTMKRDVYLPAMEAVTTGIGVLGRLADLSVAPEKLLDEWAMKSPALSRAALVANDRTLETLSLFTANVSAKIMSLGGVRTRLMLKTTNRQAMMDEITRLNAENAQRIAQLQNATPDSLDAAHADRLRREFESARTRVAELLPQHDTLNRQLLDEQLRFSELCYRSAVALNAQVTPLLASARAELGLPFDIEGYTRMANEVQKKTEADLAHFFDEMRALAGEEMGGATPRKAD